MGFTAQLSLRTAASPAFDKLVITAHPQCTCELQEPTHTHTGVPEATSTRAETFPGRGQGCGTNSGKPAAFPQLCPKNEHFFHCGHNCQNHTKRTQQPTPRDFLGAEAELLITFLFLANYLLVINCQDICA